ncbi:hypothetical protein JOF56_000648 [Kibdelosporangium banguiense]|uniref:NACHT domain-containing protein n=1 Tax=Kibdelosporangium banguiense TaxID=1365924 RepID=A0ABS4T7A8_9PSEU|nr:NACHT domain-containing protein [Kibdelosporangium banguiense]MBP2320263.1 hypothetical protein [Kibdelosporangium banguiense]
MTAHREFGVAVAPDKSRKRTLIAFITAGTLFLVLSAFFLVSNSLSDNDSVASVISAYVSLATGFSCIVSALLRKKAALEPGQEAHALAQRLLDQWAPEIRHRRRRFGSTRTIPLTWAQTDRNVAADPETIIGSHSHLGQVRLKLDGRLDDNPDKGATLLAQGYNSIPSMRLVVLGEPGAGKTFLAIMLTVGLLRQYTQGDHVPVFLSLSTWDPVLEPLDDWIVRCLAAEHYGDDETTPRSLLTRNMILPVLDGLDEIPEHLRRRAIRRINETLDGDRPLILTCRAAEYENEVAGGAPVLLRSPVIEVRPLTVTDVQAHLSESAAWADVVGDIEQNPNGPLGSALTTPLMLSLFTAAYRDRRPDDLLGDTEFTTRHAVEDHLVDALVDSAYPAAETGEGRRPWRPWTSQQARRWLTYLAQYLHKHGERDLAWWKLAHRKQGAAILFIFFVIVAGSFLTLSLIVEHFTTTDDGNFDATTSLTFSLPLGAMLLGTFWTTAQGLETKKCKAGNRFRTDMRSTTIGVLAAGLIMSPLLILASLTNTHTGVAEVSAFTAEVIVLSLLSGTVAAVHNSLAERTATTGRGSPLEFLRQNRRSAVFTALPCSLIVGILSLPAIAIAGTVGDYVGQRLARILSLPTVTDQDLPPLTDQVYWQIISGNPFGLLIQSGTLAVFYSLILLAGRPWMWFLGARAGLAVKKRLPWRTMRFLIDAHSRGILRRTGASYQFWHVSLQERLVINAVNEKTPPKQSKWRTVAATAAVAVAASLVLVAVYQEPPECAATDWAPAAGRMKRSNINGKSACFATIARDQWNDLARTESDAAILKAIESVRPFEGDTSFHRVAVLGDLNHAGARWHGILKGITAAQAVNKWPLVVDFVHADGSTEKSLLNDGEMNSLSSFYLKSVDKATAPTMVGPYDGAVNISIGKSHLPSRKNSDLPIIGLHEFDFPALSREYAKNLEDIWLHRSRAESAPDEEELKDGVNAEECAKLNRSRSSYGNGWNFDLRSEPSASPVFDGISQCGRTSILVDEHRITEFDARKYTLPGIAFSYLQNESPEISRQCATKLDERAPDESFSTCVALLAAANDFQIAVSPIDKK